MARPTTTKPFTTEPGIYLAVNAEPGTPGTTIYVHEDGVWFSDEMGEWRAIRPESLPTTLVRLVRGPEIPTTGTVDDAPAYVVEIRDQYTYLAEPSEVGHITVGMTADVEASNGGHWNGPVTRIMTVDDYEDTEGTLPSLKVLAAW